MGGARLTVGVHHDRLAKTKLTKRWRHGAHGRIVDARIAFVGFELIRKVPATLHTPLMSGANAISGITLVGALVASGAGRGELTTILGTAAVAFATINAEAKISDAA